MSKNYKIALLLGSSLVVGGVILLMALMRTKRSVPVPRAHVGVAKISPPTRTWTFAVSGDSRDTGDVIVPTIAANVLKHAAQFYWHLGDFRFIAVVDEDMQCGPSHEHERLAYEKNAWPDFIQYQVGAFEKSKTPVFLGIGNHEMILHESPEDFIEAFTPWLNQDILRNQRLKDNPKDDKIRTYYHWMVGGVDFINLDNAGTALAEKHLIFEDDQLQWLKDQLDRDSKNDEVRTIVVGMHAALPDSISAGHSMNESEDGVESGRKAYDALWDWQTQPNRHVYVVASHSHFYMENIFNTAAWNAKGKVLPGWIVGTAGAHRNSLPGGPAGWKKAKDARTNVYGYLLGTVNPDGQSDDSIKFEFHEVKADDVPSDVAARFDPGFVAWCFQRNTDCADANKHCEKSAQATYDYPAGIAPLHCK